MILRDVNDESRWRILYFDFRSTVMIQMDTSLLIVKQFITKEVLQDFLNKNLITERSEIPVIVDLNRVSEKQLSIFNKKMNFIHDIQRVYSPTYIGLATRDGRNDFVGLYKKHNFERHAAYRCVIAWLQSGFNDYSLLHKKLVSDSDAKNRNYKKKTGIKTTTGIALNDELRSHFDVGVEAYKKNRVMHIRDAYGLVIHMFYSTIVDDRIVLLPPGQRPTEKQFSYYLHKHMSNVDIEKKKSSIREYENNSRLFLKSPVVHDMGPGSILEVDAMEMDFNVVSVFNNQKNIGRPILYMLTDRYSHCIVGFHVGFDNNSIMGLTNALLNLFDDREYVLQAHGITNFDLSCWPDPFIPNEFWCDRGSDFASDKFSRICSELNIIRTLEEPAMGSMKGLIERSFGMFNTIVLPMLVGKGIIEKRYDSTHKRDACLTVHEAYQLAAAFVAYRNSTPMKNYKPSMQMMKACIDLSPISIWNYGCDLVGPPRPVTPENQMLNMFKLLIPATGTITREGVTFKGLVYCSGADDDLIKLMTLSKSNTNKRDINGRKLNAFDFRIDPRSINEIYYETKGKVRIVKLAEGRNGDYRNMTWDEYQDCIDNLKDMRKNAAEKILINRIEVTASITDIVESAVSNVHSDTKDTLLHRDNDKNENNFNNRVIARFEEDSKDDNDNVDEISKDEDLNLSVTKELSVSNVETHNENPSLFDSECPMELMNWRKNEY